LRTYDRSSFNGRGSPNWNAADDAVRHIGTNAIPLLLEWIGQEDNRSFAASMAFLALGPGAQPAVPGLMKVYHENHSTHSQCAVEDVFSWIGPGAADALPLLLDAATNADKEIRANALWALGEIHSEPEACLPLLIQALKDDGTRVSAAHALGQFGSDARPAVPRLREAGAKASISGWGVSTMEFQDEARESLKKIAKAVEEAEKVRY
jgi:HEAT repeat protein